MTQPNCPPKKKNNDYVKSVLDPNTILLLIEGNEETPGKPIKELVFTFTLNPDDHFQFFTEDQTTRIEKACNHMKYIIRQMPNTLIDVWMDVSRTGRIHWHGTICFSSEKELKLWFMERVYTLHKQHQIEMDTIADMDKWMTYCKKVKRLWDVNLKTSEIVKDKASLKKAQTSKMFKPIESYYDIKYDPYDDNK